MSRVALALARQGGKPFEQDKLKVLLCDCSCVGSGSTYGMSSYEDHRPGIRKFFDRR